MNDEFEKIYVHQNDIWGYPQVYKEIEFHPIRLHDAKAQDLFYRIFQYPKNFIGEKQFVKMSYLKYLVYWMQATVDDPERKNYVGLYEYPAGQKIAMGLLDFLKYSTKIDDIDYQMIALNSPVKEGDLPLSNTVLNIRIGKKVFSEEDFDIIRAIILEQNGVGVEYIESFNPELERFLNYENSKLGKGLSVEDQVFVYCALMKKNIDDLKGMTLYQFKKIFARLMLLLDYELYSPLEVSGQIKSKSGKKIIDHYMSPLPNQKSRYESILIPKDEYLESHDDVPDERGVIRKSSG
jgi:hypothetical protein